MVRVSVQSQDHVTIRAVISAPLLALTVDTAACDCDALREDTMGIPSWFPQCPLSLSVSSW